MKKDKPEKPKYPLAGGYVGHPRAFEDDPRFIKLRGRREADALDLFWFLVEHANFKDGYGPPGTKYTMTPVPRGSNIMAIPFMIKGLMLRGLETTYDRIRYGFIALKREHLILTNTIPDQNPRGWTSYSIVNYDIYQWDPEHFPNPFPNGFTNRFPTDSQPIPNNLKGPVTPSKAEERMEESTERGSGQAGSLLEAFASLREGYPKETPDQDPYAEKEWMKILGAHPRFSECDLDFIVERLMEQQEHIAALNGMAPSLQTWLGLELWRMPVFDTIAGYQKFVREDMVALRMMMKGHPFAPVTVRYPVKVTQQKLRALHLI